MEAWFIRIFVVHCIVQLVLISMMVKLHVSTLDHPVIYLILLWNLIVAAYFIGRDIQ